MYNFDKETCDRCGIHKDNAPTVDTGINHPQYRYSNSFYLNTNGRVLCTKCHKEEELESLFKLMDKRDKNRKEEV